MSRIIGPLQDFKDVKLAGLGPDDCSGRNPRLAYGRMTGWGQEGRFCQSAGHDINYLALSGALNMVGHKERPPVPLSNLVVARTFL
jgi:alpha-methylacyl-CoA racemase